MFKSKDTPRSNTCHKTPNTILENSLRVLVPLYLTYFIFLLSIFFIFIPQQKQQVLNQKKLVILKLAEVGVSLIAEYNARVERNEISLSAAQKEARDLLKNIAYSTNGKGYFWIGDMSGKIIMHPHIDRSRWKELGQIKLPDQKSLTDTIRGIVEKNGQGYITYPWMKDGKISPSASKLSFVKGFPPWHWILGTGIYQHEIDHEIGLITHKFVKIFKAIFIFLIILSGYITWQIIHINQKKNRAEQAKALEEQGTKKLLQLVQLEPKTRNSIIGFTLRQIIDLTQSDLGYLAIVDEPCQRMDLYIWQGQDLEPECRQVEYTPDTIDLWATPLKDRQSTIINGCPGHARLASEKWPGRHTGITRFLGVPVFDQAHIAVLAGVANKKQAYDSLDVRLLQLMAEGMWKVLETIKAREKLEKSERKYRLLAENANDVIGIIDFRKLQALYISQSIEQLLGYHFKEAVKLPPEAIFTDSSLKALRQTLHHNPEHFFSSLTGKPRSMVIELEMVKKDGSVIWTEHTIRPVMGNQREPDKMVVVFRDITQRKALENELIQSHRTLELAQKISQIGSWSFDPESGTWRYSKECFRIYEKALDEKPYSLEKHFKIFSYRGRDKLETALKKAVTQGIPFEIETLLTLPSKKEKWVHIICNPQEKPGPKGYSLSGTTQDISQRKDMERQIRQSQRLEAMGTLAGGIAHDFNNILSSIMGFTELARLDLEDRPEVLKTLDHVMAGGIRARELVKQILTFSRKTDAQQIAVKPAIMIKESLKFLKASVPKNIEIKSRIADHGCMVFADPTQIHQVLLNLLTNSVHAMKENGGCLEVSLKTIRLDHRDVLCKEIFPGRYVEISVSDTGYGIPRHLLDKIFDPFFTTKKRGEGTGLGLSTAYGIVSSLKGKILVHSRPDKGTRFNLLIPEHTSETIEIPDERSIPMITRGNSHLLIVDDEADILDWTSQMLSAHGYQISTASTAEEALKQFNAHPDRFDLLLTDLSMPGMDGISLSKQINALRPGIPILLCTGMLEGKTQEIIANTCISGIIMKPVIAGELAGAIETALEEAKG